ncbi:Rieske 2Fe-2S domain-containing protein [Sulfurimonas sp. HSL-1656]|uniref:Rieske 2Fe-2S domain-containing protein n=1 Tax=Thiomicrolovo subterrani TaxID=3131934 RepID=UPI0031F857E8
MERRNFLKVVGATGAVIAIDPSTIGQTLMAKDGSLYKRYARVQLVDNSGAPLKADALKTGENYVFNYPYAGTSCLLVKMPKPAAKDVTLTDEFGNEYIWKGGVGSGGTIVAFSGICPHQLTHINKNDSFITFRNPGERFEGDIVCDGHTSVYDTGNGCRVKEGKAPQPLAAIVLEVGSDNTLWAVGVLGKDKFHEFFQSFRRELKEQFGSKRQAKAKVGEHAVTVPMRDYTRDIVKL